MKDLGQWLVTRLQTVKQADAVTSGALGLVPDAATDMLHAAQHLNFNPRTNPLLAGLKPHYSFGQGVKDLATGPFRAASEVVRTVMPGMGHNGYNSIGDNLIQNSARSVGAVARMFGSQAAGDTAQAGKDFAAIGSGWDSSIWKGPWDRANEHPEGMIQAKREMKGLFNRWQPKALYGDTISSHPTTGHLLPYGSPRPFWNDWLGLQHMGKDLKPWQDISRKGQFEAAPAREYHN